MFILLLSLGGVVLTNSPPSWIYPILAAIAAGLLLMGVRPAGPSRWVWIGFLAAATLELAWMGNSLVEMRPFPPDAYAQIDLPETCVGGEAVRLLSPSYSVPQLLAAREGLELADGVNPLHLETYRAYMAMAMGFPADTYSVTLPPFAEGDPEADWHPALSMPALARLNITCIVSAYPLQADGLSLLKTEAGQHYYRLSTPGPRAWVETGGVVEEAEVDLMHWSPNHIELRAQGPGRLILSEVAYPGWQARIDGAQVPIGSAFNLLRSVELPEGVHSIDFRFRPWSVYLGAAISLTGALLILWAWIRK
jgi:hypothetical protein